MTYDVRRVIGDFFEDKSRAVFGLERINDARQDADGSGILPDLMTIEGNIFFESKSSYFKNGGVIREGQLARFSQNENMFYIFWYHKLWNELARKYTTPKKLIAALADNIHSCHILPIEVVSAYYYTASARVIIRRDRQFVDNFVQITYEAAKQIFDGKEIWTKMRLDPDNFETKQPHESIFVIADTSDILERILERFNPNGI